MTKPIYIINGPNLNLLGQREPDIYGSQTLTDIQALCRDAAGKRDIVFSQHNSEGAMIDQIHEARTYGSALLINPAAYTHTSVALLDAIKTLDIPVIEIHLSNPAARETFRTLSYVAMGATGTVSGFGAQSYLLGLQAAINLL
ncbi:type II 3-dehydroquinate dehydratase [Robiginitomaculum antarcticum]|uniref:type II 3-dehydroquinate dehydratase n=1 Tax=Robiginitomaculum antarcticum TaxID=437507 RepID=UPI00037A5FD0|nr:type II 3-dehydroquinate dehydratase [Robiginitomaculum antarcticum]